MESHTFAADVRQILDLVTHSLYSDREIFIRELVSNASDALDRARFEALKSEDLLPVEGEAGIRIRVDEAEKTITIEDDGIGLTHDEAIEHLGTIAQSGTKAFAAALKEGGDKAEGLIGQFGVGFYSTFMVADNVVVESLSARPGGEPVRWSCQGGAEYSIEPGTRATRGTTVTLHIREDAADFLDEDKVKEIVQKHSDFVNWPVFVGENRANQEQALWVRDPSEISDDEYKAFYKHVSGDWNDPLAWIHFRAEGTLEFQAVIFIPQKRPWELDRLDYKTGLKLYQKRIKVLDHADDLLPRFLRFARGVVDSPDVQLNVSREILQQTPVLRAIKKQLVKRVLKRLKDLSVAESEAYAGFWREMGHILKEGVHEDGASKDLLVELLRYRTSTSGDELRSFAQVKEGLAKDADTIWYLTDVDKERIAQNPMLERFRKKEIEVLLMDDPVDEWVVMSLREYDGVQLKSVAHGEVPEEEEASEDPIAKAAKDQARPLATWMGEMLRGKVADVRLSNRLTRSPSVLVNQEGAMGANMERILSAANQDVPNQKRVLEINAEHPMVQTLARLNEEGKTGLEPFARLLLDHASISEGRLDDAEGFADRLQALMEKAASAM